ncbi:MAG: hypothetical protein CBC82_00275 [Cellvibrionales bacterium TMED122]|nr:MAG: hypothetical protein CBC82_00275 [Cellvibrionales bacterium TMED122]
MASLRGKYASPAQRKRRQRILNETLLLFEKEAVASLSMSRIAELSDVSTKTLYNSLVAGPDYCLLRQRKLAPIF